MIVQVVSSISERKAKTRQNKHDGTLKMALLCLSLNATKSHVNGHKKHEMTVRRRHPVLLEQLCAVPDMNCLFRTRLLKSVLEDDVVEVTVTYCPEAEEEGVEVPFVGKHCEMCNHHH